MVAKGPWSQWQGQEKPAELLSHFGAVDVHVLLGSLLNTKMERSQVFSLRSAVLKASVLCGDRWASPLCMLSPLGENLSGTVLACL